MSKTITSAKFSHGKGVITGLLILLGVELYFHTNDFLHRYRSVFAVGRAADKIAHVVETQPSILFMGNSRVDNGIDPDVIASGLNIRRERVFNLGIPGQNTRVLSGVVRKLELSQGFSTPAVRYVMIGLDATLFSMDDSLNYSVFFADRSEMAVNGEFYELLSSLFRLWGFSTNLKGLRDPARMKDFIAASFSDREPWGGSVLSNLGYRAKRDKLTVAEINKSTNQISTPRLSSLARKYLLDTLERLISDGVRVGVFFTPKYRQRNEFERGKEGSRAYRRLLGDIQTRGVKLLHITDMEKYGPELFSDPGHLNDLGSRRYSSALADAMRNQWALTGEAH